MILKRILYVICGMIYAMLGLLPVLLFAIAPIITPVINGQRFDNIPYFLLTLYAIMFLVPALLLFVAGAAYTRLLSSPGRSQCFFGVIAFAIMLQLSIELLDKVLSGGTLSGITLQFSLTPFSKGPTLYIGHLFYVVVLIAAVHDALVCHKRGKQPNTALEPTPTAP